jgi:hypothetical protein
MGLGAAEVCRNWRVWYLGLVWFLVDATQYGVLFWCPLLLEALLKGDFNGGPSTRGHAGGALIPLLLLAGWLLCLSICSNRTKAIEKVVGIHT